MTHRAIEVLRSSDYILCEDTRHSRRLLDHYEIQRPLKSYHKFNEAQRAQQILEDIESGLTVALISDAGSPGISDPGERLVQLCVDRSISVVPIPGPCAAIAALSASGLSTERFQFCGFPPRKSQQLKRCLAELLNYSGTTILYESPNRLVGLLETLIALEPERILVVARELTKKFEEMRRGTVTQVLAHYQQHPPKGEIVVLIAGNTGQSGGHEWEEMTAAEHVAWVEAHYGVTKAEAIKAVAEIRGVPKRELYRSVHITE